MEKIGQLTHYDLDGAGCAIVLKNFVNVKSFYSAGYSKIENWIRNGKYYEFDKLYVTDLNLTQELFDILENHFGSNLIIFDHHPDTAELKPSKGAQIIFDDSKSGTKLIFDYFNDGNSTLSLKKIVDIIDAYDLWKYKNSNWSMAYSLNLLFWKLNIWNFVERFEMGFKGFTDQEKKNIKKEIKDIQTKINSLKENRYEVGEKIVSIIPGDRYVINDLGFAWPEYNYFISVEVLPDFFELSVRSRIDGNIDIGKILSEIYMDDQENISHGGGHVHAGGMGFKNHIDIDFVIDTIQKIAYNIENS